MITIKISARGQGDRWKAADYLPEELLGEHAIHLAVNDTAVRKADVWFIIEDLDDADDLCLVAPERVYFLSAEVAWPSTYYLDHPGRWRFLQQFGRILSCHPIYLPGASQALPFLPWLIDQNHVAPKHEPRQRNFKELAQAQPLDKRFDLSVICSLQSSSASHRLRIAFVRELMREFGDRIHWFGNGVQPIETKWEAIAPYRYHLALENQATHNVVTEKLYDAFLGFTFPIYWGAPNVGDYFPEASMARINIEDLSESIDTVASLLDSELWASRAPIVAEERLRVLSEFNLFRRILRIAEADLRERGSLEPRMVRLFPLEPYHAARSSGGSRLRRHLARAISPK